MTIKSITLQTIAASRRINPAPPLESLRDDPAHERLKRESEAAKKARRNLQRMKQARDA